MKYGPDISTVASMIGDPARTNMLMALMSGCQLPAAELAREAGVTASTASAHLSKLEANGLIKGTRDGRFRHFQIANLDVADAVEALIIVAGRVGHMRTRFGPCDEAMRHARTCYDHLAGRLAVDLFAHWVSLRVLRWRDDAVHLTGVGERFLGRHGIDVEALTDKKRPLCRTCMDWSERRSHLGGSLGAAILAHVVDKRWAAREPDSRVVRFGPVGERKFTSWYRELA
ncbi:MAG: helix-turn-helix transcriptional regulator [Hyphomicrobiales bacterium]|nr:helix-turn-helix transcriptional regulator [Hyphomicrobiales bacterium]